ncbi:hypothetical protein [Corynebacterium glyciniphilum]|uniref:hypothetical protein n=1 Tax=Corynebacterium glyciniphilum TaxID=1404244 RepID=UPI0011AB76FC|nr:hypothetical protein [Corynebacterium glyciniphilum]
MGKQSRRASRRNRHKSTATHRHDLTVTVGVTPQPKNNGHPSLADELRLLRSSLLYADHIDLVAPSASWLSDFRPLRGIDASDPLSTISSLPPETFRRITPDGVDPGQFFYAMQVLRSRPVDDPERVESERLWREQLPQLKRTANEVFDSRESAEIEMALEAGSVRMISAGTRFEDPIDQQVDWFRDRLTKALSDPGSHVLLDEMTTAFLRSPGEYPDGLPAVAATRSRRTSVGAGLVERLPAFPDAPMGHVLEAREELAEGRAKYRASAKKLADQLQSSALETTLPSEIDELWQDEVRPALEELRSTASKTRIASETGKRLLTEGFGLPTIAVAVANIPDLAALLPSATAAVGGVGRVAAAGVAEAFKARSTVRQHDLVYLFDVDKTLSRRRL